MSLLDAALRLTEWFEVFPLGPNGKPLPNCDDCARSKGNSCPTVEDMKKCPCLRCHSFYVASGELGQVRALWEDLNDSLIGIRTGADFLVVDFDKHGDHDGTDTFRRWYDEGVLLPTVSANTGGGGLHLYYRLPSDLEIRNGQPLGTVGVDIKGEGGYVVAAPSRKENSDRSYTWRRPPWSYEMAEIHPQLLETIVARPERRAPSIERMNDKPATRNLFHWFVGTFPMSGGNRNNHLFQAACVLGECIALKSVPELEGRQELMEVARSAGLREGEIRATIASGVNRGVNNIRAGVHTVEYRPDTVF